MYIDKLHDLLDKNDYIKSTYGADIEDKINDLDNKINEANNVYLPILSNIKSSIEEEDENNKEDLNEKLKSTINILKTLSHESLSAIQSSNLDRSINKLTTHIEQLKTANGDIKDTFLKECLSEINQIKAILKDAPSFQTIIPYINKIKADVDAAIILSQINLPPLVLSTPIVDQIINGTINLTDNIKTAENIGKIKKYKSDFIEIKEEVIVAVKDVEKSTTEENIIKLDPEKGSQLKTIINSFDKVFPMISDENDDVNQSINFINEVRNRIKEHNHEVIHPKDIDIILDESKKINGFVPGSIKDETIDFFKSLNIVDDAIKYHH